MSAIVDLVRCRQESMTGASGRSRAGAGHASRGRVQRVLARDCMKRFGGVATVPPFPVRKTRIRTAWTCREGLAKRPVGGGRDGSVQRQDRHVITGDFILREGRLLHQGRGHRPSRPRRALTIRTVSAASAPATSSWLARDRRCSGVLGPDSGASGGARPPSGRRDQNKLAGEFLRKELLLRVADVAERKCLCNDRAYLAAFDVGDEVLEHDIVLKRTP